MAEPYPILRVADDAPLSLEDMGSKEKFWFRDENGEKCLFKAARPGTGPRRVAGGESFHMALWALGLYVCVQFLESYLLTPLIQARAVSMPPAAVILNQLVFGAVFGLVGLALATPLAAAATVPLREVFGIGENGNTKKT